MAKAKQLKSGTWRILVYAGKENGKNKYKSITAPTRKEAEYLAAEYSAHRKENENIPSMTLGDAIDQYIAVKQGVWSPKTTREYLRYRRIYFQGVMDIRISDLTSAILQREVSSEAMKYSPKSVRNVYGLVSAALNMFQPEKKYKVLLPQKEKKNIVIPQGREINNIFDAFENTDLELPVYLAACLGLRRSEISALDLNSDIDYEKNTVTVSKAMVEDKDNNWVIKAPKAYESSRTLDAPEFLMEKLREARDAGYVMPNPTVISKKYSRVMKSIGLEKIRFHDLRHPYVKLMTKKICNFFILLRQAYFARNASISFF